MFAGTKSASLKTMESSLRGSIGSELAMIMRRSPAVTLTPSADAPESIESTPVRVFSTCKWRGGSAGEAALVKEIVAVPLSALVAHGMSIETPGIGARCVTARGTSTICKLNGVP